MYSWSPIEIAGRRSSCVMPRRKAASGPSTATRSPRAECPASGKRPVSSSALTARYKSGEAARTASLKALGFSGSLTGDELTSSLPTSTSLMVPAATTPLRRNRRPGASQGSALGSIRPEAAPGRAVTNNSVAASWSNWLMMRLPAVRVNPMVATKADMPITTPRTVRIMRPGRANIPATASLSRSRTDMADRRTVAGTVAGSVAGTAEGACVTVPPVIPNTAGAGVDLGADWSVKRPSTMRTLREARSATFGSCVTMARVRPSRFNSAKKSRIEAELAESKLPVGSSHNNRLGLLTSARAMATRCFSPPDNFKGRKSARCASPTR